MKRMAFKKAYAAERKSWRWCSMDKETEITVMAFCACVALRMKGESIDDLIKQCTDQGHHNAAAKQEGAV